MKMVFIDESDGSIDDTTPQPDFLVVTGVLIDSELVPRTDVLVKKFRDTYLNGERIKDLRKARVSVEEKKRLTSFLFESFSLFPRNNFSIISIVLGGKGIKKLDRDEILLEGYYKIVERAFMEICNVNDDATAMFFLDQQNQKIIKKLDEKLNVFIEEEKRREGKLCEKVAHNPAIIVENNIVDLADLVAFSVNKATTNFFKTRSELKGREDELRHYNEFLQMYWKHFCNNPKTKLVSGFGIKYWEYW